MLESKELLDVIPLELENFFVLIVFQNEHLILLMLNLLLKEYIKLCGLHKAESQISWNDDVHDIDLFNDYTIWFEFSLKIFFKLCAQFGLNITDFLNLDLFQEISDTFITFFRKELFKSVWTKVVKELFDICFIISLLAKMEVDTHIN